MSGFRLNLRDGVGTAIGDKSIQFVFDGKPYRGREGDSLCLRPDGQWGFDSWSFV